MEPPTNDLSSLFVSPIGVGSLAAANPDDHDEDELFLDEPEDTRGHRKKRNKPRTRPRSDIAKPKSSKEGKRRKKSKRKKPDSSKEVDRDDVLRFCTEINSNDSELHSANSLNNLDIPSADEVFRRAALLVTVNDEGLLVADLWSSLKKKYGYLQTVDGSVFIPQLLRQSGLVLCISPDMQPTSVDELPRRLFNGDGSLSTEWSLVLVRPSPARTMNLFQSTPDMKAAKFQLLALLADAGPLGMTQKQLKDQTKRSNVHHTLASLRELDMIDSVVVWQTAHPNGSQIKTKLWFLKHLTPAPQQQPASEHFPGLFAPRFYEQGMALAICQTLEVYGGPDSALTEPDILSHLAIPFDKQRRSFKFELAVNTLAAAGFVERFVVGHTRGSPRALRLLKPLMLSDVVRVFPDSLDDNVDTSGGVLDFESVVQNQHPFVPLQHHIRAVVEESGSIGVTSSEIGQACGLIRKTECKRIGKELDALLKTGVIHSSDDHVGKTRMARYFGRHSGPELDLPDQLQFLADAEQKLSLNSIARIKHLFEYIREHRIAEFNQMRRCLRRHDQADHLSTKQMENYLKPLVERKLISIYTVLVDNVPTSSKTTRQVNIAAFPDVAIPSSAVQSKKKSDRMKDEDVNSPRFEEWLQAKAEIETIAQQRHKRSDDSSETPALRVNSTVRIGFISSSVSQLNKHLPHAARMRTSERRGVYYLGAALGYCSRRGPRCRALHLAVFNAIAAGRLQYTSCEVDHLPYLRVSVASLFDAITLADFLRLFEQHTLLPGFAVHCDTPCRDLPASVLEDLSLDPRNVHVPAEDLDFLRKHGLLAPLLVATTSTAAASATGSASTVLARERPAELLFSAVASVPALSARVGVRDRSFVVVVHGDEQDRQRYGHLRHYVAPTAEDSKAPRDQPVVYDEFCLGSKPLLVRRFWKTLLNTARRRRLRYPTKEESRLPWIRMHEDDSDPVSQTHLQRVRERTANSVITSLIFDSFKDRRLEAAWKMLDCYRPGILEETDFDSEALSKEIGFPIAFLKKALRHGALLTRASAKKMQVSDDETDDEDEKEEEEAVGDQLALQRAERARATRSRTARSGTVKWNAAEDRKLLELVHSYCSYSDLMDDQLSTALSDNWSTVAEKLGNSSNCKSPVDCARRLQKKFQDSLFRVDLLSALAEKDRHRYGLRDGQHLPSSVQEMYDQFPMLSRSHAVHLKDEPPSFHLFQDALMSNACIAARDFHQEDYLKFFRTDSPALGFSAAKSAIEQDGVHFRSSALRNANDDDLSSSQAGRSQEFQRALEPSYSPLVIRGATEARELMFSGSSSVTEVNENFTSGSTFELIRRLSHQPPDAPTANLDIEVTEHVLDSGGNSSRESTIRNYGKAWSLYMNSNSKSMVSKTLRHEQNAALWTRVLAILNPTFRVLKPGTPQFEQVLSLLSEETSLLYDELLRAEENGLPFELVHARDPELVDELLSVGLALRVSARHAIRLVSSLYASRWTVSSSFAERSALSGESDDEDREDTILINPDDDDLLSSSSSNKSNSSTNTSTTSDSDTSKNMDRTDCDDDEEDVLTAERLLLRPWLRPDGGTNWDLLHSIFFKCITTALRYPGIPRDRLISAQRVLGEAHVRDVIDALVLVDLLRVETVERTAPSLLGRGARVVGVQHSVFARPDAIDAFDPFPMCQ